MIKDNEEYIKEKKKEKESYEQKIGLLTYVGQSAAESKRMLVVRNKNRYFFLLGLFSFKNKNFNMF